jgi:tetratricopeptide (TPR) repeat protein
MTPEQQRMLAACTVFRGGFTLALAEATLPAAKGKAGRLLSELVDHSMLRAMPGVGRRFGLYHSIQAFASAHLEDEAAAHSDHADGVLRCAEQWVEDGTERSYRDLVDESDNLLAVFDRMRDDRRTRALLCLQPVEPLCLSAQRAPERWTAALHAASPQHRPAALAGRALAATRVGRYDEAEADVQQVLAMDDLSSQGRAWYVRGGIHRGQGELRKALASFEHAQTVYAEVADVVMVAECGRHIGFLHQHLGNTTEALEQYDRAAEALTDVGDERRAARIRVLSLGLRLDRIPATRAQKGVEQALTTLLRVGDRPSAAAARFLLARLTDHTGPLDEAVAQFKASVTAFREVAQPHSEVAALGCLAGAHAELGEVDEALDLLEQAGALARRIGHRLGGALIARRTGQVLALRDAGIEAHRHFLHAASTHRELGAVRPSAVDTAFAAVLGLGLGIADAEARLTQAAEAGGTEGESCAIIAALRGLPHTAMVSRDLWFAQRMGLTPPGE